MDPARQRSPSIGKAVKTVKPNLVSASAIMPSLVVRLSSDQEKKKEPVDPFKDLKVSLDDQREIGAKIERMEERILQADAPARRTRTPSPPSSASSRAPAPGPPPNEGTTTHREIKNHGNDHDDRGARRDRELLRAASMLTARSGSPTAPRRPPRRPPSAGATARSRS
ncbi:hypothetical protein SO694_0007713 [Aureococcus anophagefferens]|uniref:Uncharacterized protein n=1 Tax=Aureococcus anophagefferens TaxID=44056 RepID=A0ABR1FHT0_AURAN